MKYKIWLVYWLFQTAPLYSQNLVNNCSFEQYSACPTNETQLYLATGWGQTFGDADYYNACSSNPYWSVPPAGNGSYQLAATGGAFAGLILFGSGYGPIEAISTQLIQPMVIGTRYYISFKVSLVLDQPGGTNLACDKIGIKFTSGSNPLVDNFTHLFASSVITDTMNWVSVAGSFIADSAYTYLHLGIFFTEANVNIIKLLPTAPPPAIDRAYYYVDDICVSSDSNAICENQIGFSENEQERNRYHIFPNPSGKEVRLQCHLKENEKGVLEIINVLSSKILNYELQAGNNKFLINTRNIEEGIYFYKVIVDDKVVAADKLVIIR